MLLGVCVSMLPAVGVGCAPPGLVQAVGGDHLLGLGI